MIDELFNQHNFDPTVPGQLLIVEHVETTDQYRIGPLVVVSNQDGYRVSRAIFAGGEMKSGLSVSFDPEGNPIGATNDWGSQVDPAEAWKDLEELISQSYLGTKAEYRRT